MRVWNCIVVLTVLGVLCGVQDAHGATLAFPTAVRAPETQSSALSTIFNPANECGGICDPCPMKCNNGLQDQDETGVDCGGSCPQQDCCGNGYADVDLGETGVDCGGSCGSCTGPITYFVSTLGDDEASGTLPTEPWQTISKVNSSVFQPGDSILFRRGDTWRESLVITWSGSAEAYITFGAYGSGAKPQILSSERAADWSLASGSTTVWQSGTSLAEPFAGHPSSIFFGEIDGTVTWGRIQDEAAVNVCGSNFSLLQQEYDWCWDNDTVFVLSPANPGSRYAFIEVPQRRGGITMQTHQPTEFITIDGFELMFGTMYGYNDGWPMDYEVSGLNILNNHIGFIGTQGSASAMGLVIWHSDMIVRNNDIHDCGRRSISYNVYTDNGRSHPNLTFENVLFEYNYLHNGFHTTGFDISHGDSASYPDTFSNFIFRNNFILDNSADDPTDQPNDWTSMGLYLWPGSGHFTGFKIHNNILKNIKQKAFAFGGVDHLEIFNNVIYGMNPNIGTYRPMVSISGDSNDLRFQNNIIHGTVSDDSPDGFMVRCVYLGSGTRVVTDWDNNIYYQEDESQPVFRIDALGESYHMSEWLDFLAATGWDGSSPLPQDPMFVDPTNNDFRLRPGSPAIDAGVSLPGRTSDFCGNPLDSMPDIGAIEYRESTIFEDGFESGNSSAWSGITP